MPLPISSIAGATIFPATATRSRYFCLNGDRIALYGNEKGELGAYYGLGSGQRYPANLTSEGKPFTPSIGANGEITGSGTAFSILYSPVSTAELASTELAVEAKYEMGGAESIPQLSAYAIRGSDASRWEIDNLYDMAAQMSIVAAALNVSGANASSTPIFAECKTINRDYLDNLLFIRTTNKYQLQVSDSVENIQRIRVTVTLENTGAFTANGMRFVTGFDLNTSNNFRSTQSFGNAVSPRDFVMTSKGGNNGLSLGLGVENNQIGSALWVANSSRGVNNYRDPWGSTQPYVLLTGTNSAEIRSNPLTSYQPEAADTIRVSTAEYTSSDFVASVATELSFTNVAVDRVLMLMSPAYTLAPGGSATFVYYYYLNHATVAASTPRAWCWVG